MVTSDSTRRRLVELVGGVVALGLAGCTTDQQGDGGTPTDEGDGAEGEHEEELPEGVSEEEFVRGPVPEEYRTARSQADEEREVDQLRTKESVRFQEASEAVEAGLASEGQSCENCAEFIPDKNGDGFGACAKVEGYVGGEDWCVIWESLEEERAEEEDEPEEGGES